MSDIVEAVARAICVAEGLDPDKTSIGFGHRIPVGVKYKLWEAQRWKAEAAIAAVGAEIERLRARVEVLERLREAALPHLFTPSMETGIALLKAVQEAKS
jgi:hypothetical protein